MTSDEFNKKWHKYLEDRFYGMDIEQQDVIEYMDGEFEKEVKVNPSFAYAQIKLKFGTSRVYADSDKAAMWENKINQLVNG